jgi:triosephosphate isomerase (TIM)
MRRPLMTGNWKMYKTVAEAIEFVQSFKPLVVASTHSDIVLAPPYTAIRAVADRLEGSNVGVAAQDTAAEPGPGAFTGEVSAAMVREAGARYAIIGHSERRQYFGETDESVNRKIRAATSAGLVVIACVGEQLADRDAGNAQGVVGRQLNGGLQNLTASEASRTILAYEPIWAIGTGRTASPEIAQEMHAFIRARVRSLFGDSIAESMQILYGGSIKPENIAALMDQPDIDGGLVGGASLEPDSFARIVNYNAR